MKGNRNGNKNNAVVITADELNRIRETCALSKELEATRKANEKTELYEKSQTRVKNWPNTIEALRRKKDEERIRRLEQDEIERRKVDAEEEALQNELRQQALERANKMLHDGQDQVKAFHSKMMMCDILQERDAQKQLNSRKKEINSQIEKHWVDQEKQQLQEANEKAMQKDQEIKKNKQKNAKVIKEQLHDFKKKYINKMQEEKLQGEIVKRQVQEDIAREKIREEERRQKAIEQRDEFKRANHQLQEAQEAELRRQKEEEDRIAEFAKKKEALDQLKKEKEEAKFKEKQAVRQKLIDRQIEVLKTIKNTDEERLGKQVMDATEKATRQFEENERKKRETKEMIEESRQTQIQKKRQEAEDKKQEEQEFKEFWKVRNYELANAEARERDEERERAKELADYLKKQSDFKQKKAIEEFKKEQEAASKVQALLDQEDKEFYSYAEKCMNDWADAGKNVKPLILELKSYKKKTV